MNVMNGHVRDAISTLEAEATAYDDANPAENAAAACLARSIALTEAAVILDEAGRHDVCGPLFRQLVECFIVGAAVLLIDEERHRLVDAQKTEAAKLATASGIKNTLGDPSKKEAVRLRNVAIKLDKVLNERNDTIRGRTVEMYDTFYRAESTFGGHGINLGLPYVRKDNSIRLRPVRTHDYPSLAANYSLWLGWVIANEAGRPTEVLEKLIPIFEASAVQEAKQAVASRSKTTEA